MKSGRADYSGSDALWRELVYRGVESDELDYKAAMNWNLLSKSGRAKLVRHCLAFANTRGGYLVIGVGEDASGHPSDYQGLTKEELHSFDPSTVTSFIHRLTDPPINFTIERPEIDGKRYVIFAIKPFSSLPHICASGVDGELLQGVFYIRTKGASSRPAVSAMEMQGLIRRALRNQRAMLGQMLRGILSEARDLAESGTSADRRFTVEQEQFSRYLRGRWPKNGRESVRVEFYVRPVVYDESRCSLKRLEQGAEAAVSGFFPAEEAAALYRVSTAVRAFDPEKCCAAEFFQSALVCRAMDLPLSDKGVADISVLKSYLTGFCRFAEAFYTAVGLDDSMLQLTCCLPESEGLSLGWADGFSAPFAGESARASIDIPAVDLASAPEMAAGRLFIDLGEQFLLPPRMLQKAVNSSVVDQ